jgi:hypothetical protein
MCTWLSMYASTRVYVYVCVCVCEKTSMVATTHINTNIHTCIHTYIHTGHPQEHQSLVNMHYLQTKRETWPKWKYPMVPVKARIKRPGPLFILFVMKTMPWNECQIAPSGCQGHVLLTLPTAVPIYCWSYLLLILSTADPICCWSYLLLIISTADPIYCWSYLLLILSTADPIYCWSYLLLILSTAGPFYY